MLTLCSTTYVGAEHAGKDPWSWEGVLHGLVFAAALLGILLAHEFGHYIAARMHRVDVSPPYFIPMPFMLLGTMGAVIRMRGESKDKNALFDIGAAGPIAGFFTAIPVLCVGLSLSPVMVLPKAGYMLEGHSLIYEGIIWLIKGNIPVGSDVSLHPVALAGWAGLLVTMMNLIPVGQLDGGHIAYAIWGDTHARWVGWIHKALFVMGICTGAFYGYASLQAGKDPISGSAVGLQWIMWAGMIWLMHSRQGLIHPPIPGELSVGRKKVGMALIVLFLLLFMPYWMRVVA